MIVGTERICAKRRLSSSEFFRGAYRNQSDVQINVGGTAGIFLPSHCGMGVLF